MIRVYTNTAFRLNADPERSAIANYVAPAIANPRLFFPCQDELAQQGKRDSRQLGSNVEM